MTDQKTDIQPVQDLQQTIQVEPNMQPQTNPQENIPAKTGVNKDKLKELLGEVFSKITANKKLTIVLVSIVSIFVLVIIAGIIFRLVNSSKQGAAVATPSPEATPQVILTDESRANELRLKQLREDIQKIDVNQKYLTPPTLEFEINF